MPTDGSRVGRPQWKRAPLAERPSRFSVESRSAAGDLAVHLAPEQCARGGAEQGAGGTLPSGVDCPAGQSPGCGTDDKAGGAVRLAAVIAAIVAAPVANLDRLVFWRDECVLDEDAAADPDGEGSELMTEMIVLALQCDATRAITFMLGNSASDRDYGFLGVPGTHHELSHHQSLQSNYDKLKIIDHWEVQQFAYLLEKLKATTDVEGQPLLSSTMVFFSSEISDGNRHNHTNMPVLLAGRANGYFATGRHVRYRNEQPVANLFMSMLDAMGVPVNQFGDDGTALLPDLRS